MKFKIKRSKQDKNPIEVNFEFGDDIGNAVELFGEKVVFGLFVTATKQQLSDYVRKTLEKNEGLNQTAIQNLVNEWSPAVEKRSAANVKRALKTVNELSPEEKAALLAQISA